MIHYWKMHGLGNRFVIYDMRGAEGASRPPVAPDADQTLFIENGRAGAFMRITNADGREAEACGNGARCVADILMRESGTDEVALETRGGQLSCWRAGAGAVSVDMGAPRLEWREIPLAGAGGNTRRVRLEPPLDDTPALDTFCAVNMGNPHAVFFVEDPDRIDLAAIGPRLETHPMFPEGANISFARAEREGRLHIRVWERGAGATLACGSAACAALVAAVRLGLARRVATLVMPGGRMAVDWRARDDHVIMTGPVALEDEGEK